MNCVRTVVAKCICMGGEASAYNPEENGLLLSRPAIVGNSGGAETGSEFLLNARPRWQNPV